MDLTQLELLIIFVNSTKIGKVGWHRFPGVKIFTSPLMTSTPDLKSSTERKRKEQQQTELSRCMKSSTGTGNAKNQE